MSENEERIVRYLLSFDEWNIVKSVQYINSLCEKRRAFVNAVKNFRVS
jgi:hypothetical protein